MKDDLISRKAAIEAVKIPDDGCNNPSERHGIIFARVEARRAIQSIPSIPAVPLEPLCKWLGSQIDPCICIGCYKKDYEQSCKIDENTSSSECWKEILTNWMERLNDMDCWR